MKGFKTHLPTKICPVCARPFSWRKKWAKNWQDVVYCSTRCRSSKPKKKPTLKA
ncbi:DUF2256 domain-containing protein [Vibrio mytili]|uniref:DUF2256 domain-containing protein n=1 Tax=Vibrio mytili TaxID=50718 RepID=UPI000A03C7F2|nr:DUF2256 domain-containing protein [Vibrio mytili]